MRVLVTGASSGIGRAVCEKLLADGHQPIGIARDFGKFPGAHFDTHSIDLSDLDQLPAHLKELVASDERLSNVVDISLKLEGLHRHASTHAAGVVIGDSSIINNVPLYKDPNTSVNATQFSMKYVEKAGLIKFDFLGLTTLSIKTLT